MPSSIAIFPVENLSGHPAPLQEIGGMLGVALAEAGVKILDDSTLEALLARHRVRYTGGLEQGFARALKQEAGVEAVLIPSLEAYDEALPLRVALFARLISTGDAPTVLWTDAAGAAGDDAPGILGIGLVENPLRLMGWTVDSLVASLAGHRRDDSFARKFRPKLVYRSDAVDPGRPYSIAVVPFFNKSSRKYAGEILALHMIRSLVMDARFPVVEPGVVRAELLRYRIIMEDGVSLADTETILNAVNADMVLNGELLEYQDRIGVGSMPRVDFGVLFIERRTRRVVYSSYSQNAGDDRVFFFDVGRVNTAHAMASQMARAIIERMLLASPPATAVGELAEPQKRRER